jgi:DNA-binding NarL/FixJ family response regulator
MIDLETHCIIDMIDSRDTKDVSQWLKNYPNIKLVVRDGSIGFRAAIDIAHPKAVQINDRFHIIKNLVKSISKALQKEFPGRIEIPLTCPKAKERYNYLMELTRREKIIEAKKLRKKGVAIKDISEQLRVGTTTIKKYISMNDDEIPEEYISNSEREHMKAVKKISDKVKQVRHLHKERLNLTEIAKKTGYHVGRIKEYLKDDFNPIHGQYGVRRPGILTPYREEILNLRAEGITYKEIANKLRVKGYTGSIAYLRGFVAREKRITKDLLKNKEPTELINKRWINALLYKPLEKVKISKEQLDEVIKSYPLLGKLLNLLEEFRSIMKSKDVDEIPHWIDKALHLNIKEINSYIKGLKGDYESINNAIIYNYNNGIAEGSVNKLKAIKRVMFGRNGFDLLKCKVLQLEILKYDNIYT